MRNIDMSRVEVKRRLKDLEGLIDVAAAGVQAFGKHPNPRDPAYQEVERVFHAAISERSHLESSGVVPWSRKHGLSSKEEDREIWAARRMASSYEYEGTDYKSAVKVWEPTIVVTIHGTGMLHQHRFTREEAIVLRDQLEYELSRWNNRNPGRQLDDE